MKSSRASRSLPQGFTLLEMTIVILVMLALVGIGVFSSRKMDEWRMGRAAAEVLRAVHTAQRMYLADNPTTLVANLTEAMLIPYLPNVSSPVPATLVAALGTTRSMGSSPTALAFSFNVANVTPFFTLSGLRYDPSGSFTDLLWDVGQ